MADPVPVQALPPHAQLIQFGTAYWASQMVLVAAQLGLADELSAGARSSSDLAQHLGLHPGALRRYLRSLAGMGLLTEVADQTFALTPLGAALRKDAPGSAYATIMTLTGDLCTKSWSELRHALKTGRPGIEKVLEKPFFEYLAERPEEASLFSETMVGFHGAEPPAVAEAYDFGVLRSIVDVGGATGNMLLHILKRHPGPRGVLFDLPHVVADAPAFLAPHGLADRVTIEPGSFFDAVPSGHDAYILSHVLHDWNEAQCLTILGNCRRAIASDGRLLVVEMVLPEGDAPHPGKMLDMMMLVGPGGQERTPGEYSALLGQAGFDMIDLVPTSSDVSIVVAAPR
ncbi:MAG: ArsR family transcriptional regulator [Phycisphaeraceae bacterium]|nr:ArsR family transcriptional regulator [Phycisphaeraceae bacterium]